MKLLMPLLALLLGGCSSAALTGLSAPDPQGPVLAVHCELPGSIQSWPVARVEVDLRDWRGEGRWAPVGGIPRGEGPHRFVIAVRDWEPSWSSIPADQAQVRLFSWHGDELLAEASFLAPELDPGGPASAIWPRPESLDPTAHCAQCGLDQATPRGPFCRACGGPN